MDHPESFAASLGVVSFLNSRPLIHGLDAERGMSLCFDVPSRLPGALQRGEVDAALVPVVGMARLGSAVEIVSDACIGADGDTMTVRVFSRVPPEEVDVHPHGHGFDDVGGFGRSSSGRAGMSSRCACARCSRKAPMERRHCC